MTNNVERINKNSNSSMDWSVVDALRSLADDIENGDADFNKCMVLLLKDSEPGSYLTGFRLSQMKGSEAVSLLEIIKSDLVGAINGLPSGFNG